MLCKYCGCEISDNANFCQNCGTSTIETAMQNQGGKVGRRGKTLLIGIISAIIVVVICAVTIFTMFNTSPQNVIKGLWKSDNSESNSTDNITYLFTTKGGTNTYVTDKTGFNSSTADFTWHITDDNELILLWSDTSCTRYVWNPDFASYSLSPNEYNWYLKGDNLYLSAATEQGYNIYTRQGLE